MTTFDGLMSRSLPECHSAKAYACARAYHDTIQWRRENPTLRYFTEAEIVAITLRWQEHARSLWARERGA